MFSLEAATSKLTKGLMRFGFWAVDLGQIQITTGQCSRVEYAIDKITGTWLERQTTGRAIEKSVLTAEGSNRVFGV
ncbi:unannotated protein [freshwater metagenome]|uniref:Unannotated protein n=1 Tax=freshwater metagenome TaxID=449393 RepID=A0A6J6BXA9_9ZZZZ